MFHRAGFGGLSSSFYYPYILLQVPAGILVSRFGARAVLITSAVICTVASFLFAISQTAGYAEATRILMGLGAAPTVVCAMTLAAQWFPARLFPLLAALTEMAGMVGAAVGQEVLGFVVERSGWRTGMLGCGATAAVLLVLTVLFIRDRDAGGTGERWPRAAEMKRLLTSPAILSASVAGGLVGSAGMSFGMLWGVSYFQVHHQLSLTAASLCVSFYFWGALPGMLGSAWLCSRYRNAAQLLAFGAAGTAVTLILILFVLHGQVVQSVAMFVLGVFNSTYALAFTMVKEEAPEHLSGVAMGLTNMTIMGIAAMLFQPLIGLLAHVRGEDVPGATTLSAIIVAQVVALAILARGRARRSHQHQM